MIVLHAFKEEKRDFFQTRCDFEVIPSLTNSVFFAKITFNYNITFKVAYFRT